MSSEPPEEPAYQSEPNILSPASPKPIHFPTPTNIHVLEMQMDVGFNQTEAHMNDPAMRNTEVRPDFWRDPNEKTEGVEEGDHASPYSTGGEAMQTTENEEGAAEAEATASTMMGQQAADSMETAAAAIAEDPELSTLPISSNATSYEANGNLATETAAPDPQTQPQPIETAAIQPSSDPSVPSAEAVMPGVSQIQADDQVPNAAQASNGTVDFQALLDTLQPAPAGAAAGDAIANTAPLADSMTVATTISPSTPSNQSQLLPPGIEATASASSPLSASGLGVPPTGLPPRPPPQEQPLIHPNYVHSQHIRDYHPHAAHPAFVPHARSGSGSQGNVADAASKNYVPPVMQNSPASAGAGLPSNPTASTAGGSSYATTTPAGSYPTVAATPTYQDASGTNGASASTASLPGGGFVGASGAQNYTASPTSAQTAPGQNYAYDNNSYGQAGPGTPMESRREHKLREGEHPRPEDRPWDAEVQRKYDRFIEDERRYVSEGRWEQFPSGSRLFVGNLSSEKVTKRDIFHVFHPYGDLAQISIKQAYGFVQFLRMEDCMMALEKEQGTQIRDKRIHLEVSKPQKNRNQNTVAAPRRSRSPPDAGRGRPGANVDRYVSGARAAGNNRGGARDGYRPGYRSPSPRAYRERYDDRYRTRSPSPGYNRGGGGGGRFRSPSPRRDVDDDLPLPRRAPRDVPDVQIVVLDNLERDFISWVEKAFSSRSVRVDVLLLSPRLSEQAVVRRQIMEGVVAVVKLTRQNQSTGKMGLQIFDRSQGVNNVKFEEYDNLDPPICVELVLRAKQTHAPPTPSAGYGGGFAGAQQNYGAPPPQMPPQQQYGGYPPQTPGAYGQTPSSNYPPPYAQPPSQAPQPVPPNLQNLITNMDAGNLQSLLSAMNTPQSAQHPYTPGPGSQPNSAVAMQQLQNNPALAGYLQQQAQQQQQQQQQAPGGGGGGGAVNMQEILARLGNYQQ